MAHDVGEEDRTRRRWVTRKRNGERERERGGAGEGDKRREASASAACRYSMPIHIQPGVERHEASRK